MKREFYLSIHNYIVEKSWRARAVGISLRLLTGTIYVTYPLMLIFLWYAELDALLRSVLVPAVGFLAVTVLRAGINAPRPYEVLEIPAIVHKETRGKSFPSRHSACGAVIAVTALRTAPLLGLVLLVVSLLIAVSRVLAGVHFLRDVLTGWLLGALIGAAAFLF